MAKPERLTVIPDHIINSPIPPEQLSKGMELLDTAASKYNRTVKDFRDSLDPTFKKEEIIQNFFSLADGQIDIPAMRRTLMMEPLKLLTDGGKYYEGFDPFNGHWKKYIEAKARKNARSSSLVNVASKSA